MAVVLTTNQACAHQEGASAADPAVRGAHRPPHEGELVNSAGADASPRTSTSCSTCVSVADASSPQIDCKMQNDPEEMFVSTHVCSDRADKQPAMAKIIE